MKTHTNNFKTNIKLLGRELDSIITYELEGETIELGNEQLNSVSPHYEADILKSVMKQLDIDSNVDIPIGTEINYQFGLKVGNTYEYVNYGNYIVYSSEKQEDTRSWKIVAYDKMLYAMKDYESLEVEYPITIKEYLSALCTKIGLTLKDTDFVNQDKELQNELYLDANGNSLNYTFRDVLDEIAGATASTICINEDDEAEVRYVQNVGEYSTVSGTDINLPNVDDEADIDLSLEGDTQQAILPNEYQAVEYIESTGTQYIDTNFKPNQNTKVVLDFINKATVDSWLFGSRIAYNDKNYSVLSWASGSLRTDYYNGGADIYLSNNVRYILDKDKNITTTYLNGVKQNQISASYASFAPNLNMYLFSLNSNGSATTNTKMQLYSCKIYNNNVLVRNFAPCYRKSDNVIGLFDLVNNVFYINKGTGTFTKGSNTSLPSPNSPQNINVVSGENSIEVVGKNLLPTNSFTLTKGGTRTLQINFPTPIPAGEYTLSCKITNKSGFTTSDGLGWSLYDGSVSPTVSRESFQPILSNTTSPFSSTRTTTGQSTHLYVYVSNSLADGATISVEDLQLELNSRATIYEPYKSKNYKINLGKNLFDKSATPYQSSKYIAYDGTIVSSSEFSIYKISLEPNTTYTLTNSGGSYSPGLCFYNSSNTLIDGFSYNNRQTITFITPNDTSYILMSAVSLSSSTRYDLDIMQLERGTQATIYTPYFEPIQLLHIPNTNYYDKIDKSSGKNLLDYSTCVIGDINGSTGQEETQTMRIRSDFIKIEPSTSYVCSLVGGQYTTFFYTENKTYIAGGGASWINSGTSFISPSNARYVRLKFWKQQNTAIALTDIKNVMFNIGTTALEYEPYGTDWYLKKEIGKVVLDGSEIGWSLNTSSGLYRAEKTFAGVMPYTDTSRHTDRVVCSHFTPKISNEIGNFFQYQSILLFYVPSGITTVEAWKTWLGTNNTTVYYVLATPTYTKITNENLIKQLEAIRLLIGENNISITSTMLSSPITLKYLSERDTIDEEYLKDINVNFGEKYGKVNSVVLSRSAGADNIYRADEESIEENGLCEIKISDNQILNGNNRDEFIDNIFNKLNGFEYYTNDFVSTGITYYDLCDKYNVVVDGKKYACVMLNDEAIITQGLEENIHTDMPEESETDYKKADKTDRKINQTYLIVDKQNQQIDTVVQTINQQQTLINETGEQIEALGTRLTQTTNSISASVATLQNELEDGVGLVKTTTVLIDDNGLNVSTDNSKVATTMTTDAFKIVPKGSQDPLAFFGYDSETNSTKAVMDNLTVTNYFVSGYHRTEKMNVNGEYRTGQFYIG